MTIINFANRQGLTPLDQSMIGLNPESFKLLTKAGAELMDAQKQPRIKPKQWARFKRALEKEDSSKIQSYSKASAQAGGGITQESIGPHTTKENARRTSTPTFTEKEP